MAAKPAKEPAGNTTKEWEWDMTIDPALNECIKISHSFRKNAG
jgi:hypothetical protein